MWKIPWEKISINVLSEEPEEAAGMHAKDDCSIPAGMGKYFPVQMNQEVTGQVLIEASDKTIPALVLPEIVYHIKKKLGCIFVETFGGYDIEERTDHRVSNFIHSDARGARSNTGST